MAVHWFFQFAVVRVAPNLLEALDVYGAFVFWGCICFIGFVLLGILAPETKKVPMEKMDELFDCPWYMGWRAKVDLTDMRSWSDDEKAHHEVKVEKIKEAVRKCLVSILHGPRLPAITTKASCRSHPVSDSRHSLSSATNGKAASASRRAASSGMQF